MTIAVFHGSPRKGNTYRATKIFMNELSKCGDTRFDEFFFPESIPQFCTGCQACLGNPPEACPHSRHVAPILAAIQSADALIFTTPHHGACSMSSCMKNLLDHLDFLTMNVSPRPELFQKKAFIITTGTGSAAASKPIKHCLKNWGINRVYSLSLRMFVDKWDKMPQAKQAKFEERLRRAARKFHDAPMGFPYISTVFMYYMSKIILKRYVGKGNYPYEYWRERGFFDKRPF